MIPNGPFKAHCGDGVERTFHRGGIYSKRGFVYVGKARIYGHVVETYTTEHGYRWLFTANSEGAHARLVSPPVAETAGV